MAQIWWSSLAAAAHGLLGTLSALERARVESLERPADRGRSLVGAALLRAAVAAHTGVAPADIVVDRACAGCGASHGAPRIATPGVGAPWVSVSHSGLLVVVALSAVGPVGVDVQRTADLEDPVDAGEWVRREALFKAGAGGARGGVPVRFLQAPLEGYAAAVALPAGDDGGVAERLWP